MLERLDPEGPPRVLAVSIGNTNTAFAVCAGREPDEIRTVGSSDPHAVAEAILAIDADVRAIVIASVNEPVARRVHAELVARSPASVFRIGHDIPIPLRHTLDDDAIAATGQDRLLNAVAAYRAARQACVVVDAGTAITVDFVDGEGTFHGGAIAPGAEMALAALGAGTAALPSLAYRAPDDEPFGRGTEQAMLQGVLYGARGLVRALAERYAEAYAAYPAIIATGGDAERLFRGDELIEHIVPGLTLQGVAIACEAALADDGEP